MVHFGKKLRIWLESKGKQAKGQAGFRRHHSTIDHLVTLRIIAEECRNDKSNLFCCFVDFRKAFDTVPRYILWNRLEELKVPLELRATAIMLYENLIAKLKSNEGWLKDIKCNIRVKQGCPLSPILHYYYLIHVITILFVSFVYVLLFFNSIILIIIII